MTIDAILGPLDGAHIAGGCETCDAYQEPVKISAHVWVIRICHNDDCPTLARVVGQ